MDCIWREIYNRQIIAVSSQIHEDLKVSEKRTKKPIEKGAKYQDGQSQNRELKWLINVKEYSNSSIIKKIPS